MSPDLQNIRVNETPHVDAPAGAIAPRRAHSEGLAPDGWSTAFELAGRPAPPPPTWWPCWYASETTRVRLLDALNVAVEVRRPSGWKAIAFMRSFDDAVASARRRGLVPVGREPPRDARRWPYDAEVRSC